MPHPARGDSFQYSDSFRRLHLPLLILLLLGVLLFTPGCDTASGGDTLLLTLDEVTFRFEFSSSGAVTASSVDQVDLGSMLLDRGFTKGEVVSASVASAELERVQPVGQNLSALMESVELQLNASGQSTRTVASQSTLPDSRRTDLTVQSGVDVAGFITRPSFGAILLLQGVTSADYVLEASVQFRVEVEGV